MKVLLYWVNRSIALCNRNTSILEILVPVVASGQCNLPAGRAVQAGPLHQLIYTVRNEVFRQCPAPAIALRGGKQDQPQSDAAQYPPQVVLIL
jgi:hypothetical protein